MILIKKISARLDEKDMGDKKKQAESAGKTALICLLVFTVIFTVLAGLTGGGQAQAAENLL